MNFNIFLLFMLTCLTCFTLDQVSCKYSHHWPGPHSEHDIPATDSGLWRVLKDNEKAIVNHLPYKVIQVMYGKLRVSSKLHYDAGIKVHRHPQCGKRAGHRCFDEQFCQATITVYPNGTNHVEDRDCNKEGEM